MKNQYFQYLINEKMKDKERYLDVFNLYLTCI